MLSLGYISWPYSEVLGGMNDLIKFQGKLNAGGTKAKLIFENLKHTYGPLNVKLYVAEGQDIYKFVILGGKLGAIGTFFYLPQERRLDIWDVTYPQTPIIQYKGKQSVFKVHSMLLDIAGIDNIWSKFTNVL